MNPSRAASLRRFSACGIERISPARPISPSVMMLGDTGLSLYAEMIAVATARSAARSRICIPPEIFMKMSNESSGRFIRLERMAVMICRRFRSKPDARR